MNAGTKARRHEGTKGAAFSRRRGYSFTEVMFAVVVLGIGFIMIAAMFPVAISQSQVTNDESIAASVARGAVKQVEAIAYTVRDPVTPFAPRPVAEQHMPPTEAAAAPTPAPFVPFDKSGGAPAQHGLWDAVKGNLILQTDPRYAWVPLYSRESSSNIARLVIVVVRARARGTYDATDVTPAADANLMPRATTVEIQNNVGGSGIDWVTFSVTNIQGVAEGTCVVISNHAANGPTPAGYYNGQVFRVGRNVPEGEAVGSPAVTAGPNTWELVPGNDFIPGAGADDTVNTADDLLLPATTTAYIVGRELETSGTAGTFRGTAQDVAYYSTFIQVRP